MPGIDYPELRRRLRPQAVLAALGWRPRTTYRGQWRGPCPVHGSTDLRSTVFSVNTHRGVWQCFKCHQHGNLLELYARLRYLPLHAAAVELADRCGVEVPWIDRAGNPLREDQQPPARDREEEPVHLSPGLYGPHARRVNTAARPTSD